MKQKDLSPRQHRWMDVLNEFDYTIEYIPGDTNKLTDALSRIYSDEQEGVVRAESEYVDDVDEPIRGSLLKAHPIYVDAASIPTMNAEVRRSSRLAEKLVVDYKETQDRKSKVESEDESSSTEEPPTESESEDKANEKDAIMSAQDVIIASQVQNTVQANKKHLPASYKQGDLVYLSTKNISLPKGRARKLAPKYLGPFPITKVIKEGATYQLELSDELTKRGVNRAFHTSLLRPHVPNDDRRFPGRLPIQIPGFGEKPKEWIVDRIVTHNGTGQDSEFQILWKAGDKTWATYREVA